MSFTNLLHLGILHQCKCSSFPAVSLLDSPHVCTFTSCFALFLSHTHASLFFLISPSTSSSLSVYCCCCLANISIPGVGVAVPEFRPFFYVNVADISALENELSYVACKWMLETCLTFVISPLKEGIVRLFGLTQQRVIRCVFLCLGTTEKIFEEKKDLYDVYVDNQNVKTYRDGLKPLLRLSTADREKYRKLTEQR